MPVAKVGGVIEVHIPYSDEDKLFDRIMLAEKILNDNNIQALASKLGAHFRVTLVHSSVEVE